jgi:uncharacterized protein (DUF305 family)
VHRRVVLAAAAAVLLAGCGGPPGTAPAPHNDTDVMFAQMVRDHHRQAAGLLQILAERAGRAEVRTLATTMRGQWEAEAAQLDGWLDAWQAPRTANPDEGLHAGHGDLHSLRPGDIEEVRAAQGADVDRIGISLLLGHHHNTVEVARLETAGGSFPAAKELAGQITATRQDQVRTMLGLIA